jgi:hypothetical protein
MAEVVPNESDEEKILPPYLPVQSLDDPRVILLRRREYSLEPGEDFHEETYLVAVRRAGANREKTRKVYQELMRTKDIMHLIDREDPNSETARQLIGSLVAVQGEIIDAIVNPTSPNLSPER